EAPLFEVARDPVAQLGAGGHLAARPPAVDDRAAADPVPEIAAEGAELLLDGEKSLCIGHRGVDLQPVADDAGILEQCGTPVRIEAGYLGGVEAGECLAIGGALAQDRGP